MLTLPAEVCGYWLHCGGTSVFSDGEADGRHRTMVEYVRLLLLLCRVVNTKSYNTHVLRYLESLPDRRDGHVLYFLSESFIVSRISSRSSR
jgi:hypothetical protein